MSMTVHNKFSLKEKKQSFSLKFVKLKTKSVPYICMANLYDLNFFPFRAVYRNADTHLLDDPLSAVDAKVENFPNL